MCDADNNNKCTQCFTWNFVEKGCPKSAAVECSVCEKEEIKHTGCGCSTRRCNPITLDNCRPASPEPDECYTKAKKEYTNTKSFFNGQCHDCYYWNRTLKPPVP